MGREVRAPRCSSSPSGRAGLAGREAAAEGAVSAPPRLAGVGEAAGLAGREAPAPAGVGQRGEAPQGSGGQLEELWGWRAPSRRLGRDIPQGCGKARSRTSGPGLDGAVSARLGKAFHIFALPVVIVPALPALILLPVYRLPSGSLSLTHTHTRTRVYQTQR